MFLLDDITVNAREIHQRFIQESNRFREIALVAQLCVLAAILQSAGGFYPGVGYLVSAMSTGPVVIASVFSLRCGFQTYLAACMLLLFFHPGEIIIFAFTTGPLGLGLGVAFLTIRKRLAVVVLTSLFLLTGIVILLYGLKFPVLGPVVTKDAVLSSIVPVYGFCFIYSCFWAEACRLFFKRYKNIFQTRIT
ncbi:MAG: hypothetical protein VR67_01295 [Peptococcaceae bacterium BRH_c8a]|nr:MAG: hypothetical protein VR67_01295 [Peptococcaceae bacterium BRH_c8a]